MSIDSRASKVYTRTGDKGKTSLIGGNRVSKAELRLDAYGTVDELNSVIGILICDLHHDFERASEIDPTYDVGQILQPRAVAPRAASAAVPGAASAAVPGAAPATVPGAAPATVPGAASAAVPGAASAAVPGAASAATPISNHQATSPSTDVALSATRLTQELRECQAELFNIGSQLACEDDQLRAQMPNVTEAVITQLEVRMDDFSLKLTPLKNFILPGGARSAAVAHLARTVCRRAERVCVQLSETLSPSGVDPLVIRYLNRLSDYFFVLARLLNASLKITEPIWVATSPAGTDSAEKKP